MPRLYFHAHNSGGHTRDEEGVDVAGETAAFRLAVENIRSIVADEARRGLIDLEGRIDVADREGRLLLQVSFVEAFEIRLPDDDTGSGGAGLDRP